MLDWLKDKVKSGFSAVWQSAAAAELRAQFTPLEKIQGVKPRIAERLSDFVLQGEGASVVAELAALQRTIEALEMSASHSYYGGRRGKLAQSLATLIKLLPEDPNIYLRLALVYEAALQPGAGATYYVPYSAIPAFQGPVHWLSAFIVEISGAGPKQEAFFSSSLIQGMLAANKEDPVLLVRGPFFYEDPQGKSQLSRWVNRPYSYFQCLKRFSELVLQTPDIVRPAFQQRDAGSRACALEALAALKIPLGPFVEEIALLAVSGSKEVREKAELLVKENFAVFQSLVEGRAVEGSSDERFHAVRLLGRLGGDAERAFLAGQ